MGSVDRRIYGVAASTAGATRLIGQTLSMGIAALIIATHVGNVQITPAYYPAFMSGFRLAFALFAVLCLVGVFASLARARIKVEAMAGSPKGT